MLLVKTTVRDSEIHGRGLFAGEPLKFGDVVWSYDHTDSRVPLEMVRGSTTLDRGYVNPNNRGFAVVCGDDARFMNFSDDPNLVSGKWVNGEYDLIASRNIQLGEELTVDTSTDYDAKRKLGGNL